MSWFRWYEQTCEDGKFRAAARLSRVTVRDVIALWAFILEDAANHEHRGECHRDHIFMASVLDFEDGVVERILHGMSEVGLINIETTHVVINNWGKRQFESDVDPTAARRQREKRERDKQHSHEPVTRDTGGSEDRVQIQKTDKEKKDSRTVASATRPKTSEDFEEFWKAYPRRLGANPRKPAFLLFEAAVRQGADPAAIAEGARRCAAADHDKIGTPYIPQAVKWLRDQRWNDYAAGPPGDSGLNPDQRARLFEELRNGGSEKGTGLRAVGPSACPIERDGRPASTRSPNHQPRHAGMASLGQVFREPPGVRACGDEAGQAGDEQGNDGAGHVARVV